MDRILRHGFWFPFLLTTGRPTVGTADSAAFPGKGPITNPDLDCSARVVGLDDPFEAPWGRVCSEVAFINLTTTTAPFPTLVHQFLSTRFPAVLALTSAKSPENICCSTCRASPTSVAPPPVSTRIAPVAVRRSPVAPAGASGWAPVTPVSRVPHLHDRYHRLVCGG